MTDERHHEPEEDDPVPEDDAPLADGGPTVERGAVDSPDGPHDVDARDTRTDQR